MQDLNVINKLNNEAVLRDVPNQQAAGKFVVLEYAGLTFVGHSVHDTEAEANAKAAELANPNSPTTRARVITPTTKLDSNTLAGR